MSVENENPTFEPLGPNGQAGFQGVLRRVGLHEILQLECLGRKSSLLKVSTPKIRGSIYICDGSIIHAQSGTLEGEVALYGILGLRGGQFNIEPYTEPARRTISGQWESLLMEAARICDEAPAQAMSAQQEMLAANETAASHEPGQVASRNSAAPPQPPARIDEIVLCSGAGEVIFEMNCASCEDRRAMLKYLHEQVEELAGLAPTGAFDRLQVTMEGDRFVFQVRPDRRLLVRTTTGAEL
jgi:hypothetical protein